MREPCGCGCGGIPKTKEAKYCLGHYQKTKSKPPNQPCLCECGLIPKTPGAKYYPGHYMNVLETKEKYKKFARRPHSEEEKENLRIKGKKRWADDYEKTLNECMNPAIKNKMLVWQKSDVGKQTRRDAANNRLQDPDYKKKWLDATHTIEIKQKQKQTTSELWQTEEYRNKLLNIINSKEFKQKRSETMNTEEYKQKISKITNSEEYRSNSSQNFLRLWKDPEFQKHQSAGRAMKPNKPEQLVNSLLQEMFPNNYKYVGDFSFVIGGKNPDFMNCNGQKKLIEFFGVHWHSVEDEEIRINHFKQYGFDTLVIWEDEINKINLENLKLKLTEFHNRGHL